MSSIYDVKKNFERFDFSVKYIPEIFPIKDLKEINRIKERLNSLSKFDCKTIAFLEDKLEKQMIGTPSLIHAFKSYSSFGDLRWTSKSRPFMQGTYSLKDNLFSLSFMARFPEEAENLKKNLSFMGLTTFFKEDCSGGIKRLFDAAIEIERKKKKISENINIVHNQFLKLISPQFQLNITSSNLDEAHKTLIDTMDKMGYKNGVLYEG